MQLDLTDKTALITGASKGIGLAIARTFAAEGCHLHLAARNGAAMEEAKHALEDEYGVRVTVHALDLSSTAAMETLAAAAGEIDILVNNAGIDTTELIENMSTEMWDEMMRVNLKSIFLCSRQVIPAMKRKRWGRMWRPHRAWLETAATRAHASIWRPSWRSPMRSIREQWSVPSSLPRPCCCGWSCFTLIGTRPWLSAWPTTCL